MKKISSLAIFLLLHINLSFSQGVTQNLHSNHAVFGDNKLSPHADFFAFEEASLAEKSMLSASNRFQSLNGKWKFLWVRSPKDRPQNFYEIDLDDSHWNSIPVPANW